MRGLAPVRHPPTHYQEVLSYYHFLDNACAVNGSLDNIKSAISRSDANLA